MAINPPPYWKPRFPKYYAHWTLITDGSGWIDGFGGHAAMAIPSVSPAVEPYVILGCGTHSSVEREELIALLEGLQTIKESIPGAWYAGRIVVDWHSDRQNLVNALLGHCKKSDEAEDLWLRFAYYQKYFEVRPHFEDKAMGRKEHQYVDRWTKKLRAMIKYAANKAADDKFETLESVDTGGVISPGGDAPGAETGEDIEGI